MRTTIHPILIECVRDGTVPDCETLHEFAAVIAEDFEIGMSHDDAETRPIMAWARCALEGSPPRR